MSAEVTNCIRTLGVGYRSASRKGTGHLGEDVGFVDGGLHGHHLGDPVFDLLLGGVVHDDLGGGVEAEQFALVADEVAGTGDGGHLFGAVVVEGFAPHRAEQPVEPDSGQLAQVGTVGVVEFFLQRLLGGDERLPWGGVAEGERDFGPGGACDAQGDGGVGLADPCPGGVLRVGVAPVVDVVVGHAGGVGGVLVLHRLYSVNRTRPEPTPVRVAAASRTVPGRLRRLR